MISAHSANICRHLISSNITQETTKEDEEDKVLKKVSKFLSNECRIPKYSWRFFTVGEETMNPTPHMLIGLLDEQLMTKNWDTRGDDCKYFLGIMAPTVH